MELSEHDDFFAAMRRPLPMSFRVTGFRDEAKGTGSIDFSLKLSFKTIELLHTIVVLKNISLNFRHIDKSFT